MLPMSQSHAFLFCLSAAYVLPGVAWLSVRDSKSCLSFFFFNLASLFWYCIEVETLELTTSALPSETAFIFLSSLVVFTENRCCTCCSPLAYALHHFFLRKCGPSLLPCGFFFFFFFHLDNLAAACSALSDLRGHLVESTTLSHCATAFWICVPSCSCVARNNRHVRVFIFSQCRLIPCDQAFTGIYMQ